MSKRKKKIENIHVMSAYENTMAHKEHFNPFQTGHGVHETLKHPKRAKEKSALRKELQKY